MCSLSSDLMFVLFTVAAVVVVGFSHGGKRTHSRENFNVNGHICDSLFIRCRSKFELSAFICSFRPDGDDGNDDKDDDKEIN